MQNSFMLWPTWYNDILQYKYVLITYIFFNKFKHWISHSLFNENKWQVLYIIVIYKPPQINALLFISILENIITKIPTRRPTIIIKDFNINMLTNIIESITLQNYMNTHGFHITFIQNTTQHLIIHKSTIYGLMPQLNNVILDQHKLIGHIITLYTLHSNYLTIFLNLLYHLLMN
jgi:hypothetical protein